MKYRIRVERDRSFDDDDPSGWTVTRYHAASLSWSVLFRGTEPDCFRYAQRLADNGRSAVEAAE